MGGPLIMLAPMRNPRLLSLAACAVCAVSGLLGLAFHLVLAAGADKRSALSGIWVMQSYYQEQGADAPDPKLTRDTLTLNDDGTFTQHAENHVMTTLIMTARGNYTRKGDTRTLTGVSEGYRDDGYVK